VRGNVWVVKEKLIFSCWKYFIFKTYCVTRNHEFCLIMKPTTGCVRNWRSSRTQYNILQSPKSLSQMEFSHFLYDSEGCQCSGSGIFKERFMFHWIVGPVRIRRDSTLSLRMAMFTTGLSLKFSDTISTVLYLRYNRLLLYLLFSSSSLCDIWYYSKDFAVNRFFPEESNHHFLCF